MSATLYDYWRSSAAYRLRIALGLIGIPYRAVPVDLLKGEHRGAANLARHPQGLVPTLEIDGLTLTQSLPILEYLDETRAAGFLPADPAGRQRVRALACVIAMEIHPVCNLSVARHAAEHSGGGITMQGWMHAFIPRGLAAFETMLESPATGRFCHGDGVTLADICLVPQLYNARRWEVDLAPYPRIGRIAAELDAITAVRAAHPDNHKPED
jgi:maleylacetoacetate isomerase